MGRLRHGRLEHGPLTPAGVSLLGRWSALAHELAAALRRVFPEGAVEEWLQENVHPSLKQLQALLQDLQAASPPPLPASPPPASPNGPANADQGP